MNESLPDRIRKLLSGEEPPPPIARLLGLELAEAGNGEAVFRMDVSSSVHGNPMGTVHGGIFCDLADAAMGIAYASELAANESFTTLELKVNYLRPVWDARLTARARVVSRGQTIGLVECDVTDDAGRLIARAHSTCLTLRDEQAAGR
jgi:uncharacterized protein (TIGR00369 family)